VIVEAIALLKKQPIVNRITVFPVGKCRGRDAEKFSEFGIGRNIVEIFNPLEDFACWGMFGHSREATNGGEKKLLLGTHVHGVVPSQSVIYANILFLRDASKEFSWKILTECEVVFVL
jgi:hypothetical protein